MLIDRFIEHATADPQRLAIFAGDQRVTYGRLLQRVVQAASLLRARGVAAGDRVVLAASATASFVYGYLGCHYLGAIAVPVDPKIAPQRLDFIARKATPKAVFLARAMRGSAVESHPVEELAAGGASASVDPVATGADEAADLLFTSGTTGEPKGVVLSHGAILAAAKYINAFIGNKAGDREVVPLPLSHSFGLGRLRCNLLAGGSLIIVDGFMSPGHLLGALADWNATGFACVPAGFAVLFKTSGTKLGKFSKSLRYIEIGSAAMPLKHKRRLMSLLPDTRICMHYGLTEASRSAFIEFHEAGERLESIGKPSPGVELRIVDQHGRDCAPGEPGRIVIKSAALMSGYWKDPEATRQAFVGDYLITGDIGHCDENGYLYLDAREKELINVGGREVSPVEIEALLETHPAVAACACVGIPDPQGLTGMAVKAFLVARPGVEIPQPAALAAHLRGKIETYKMPRAFEWIAELPRTASGKLQRMKLAEAEASRVTNCRSVAEHPA